jgi:hypothetical protein
MEKQLFDYQQLDQISDDIVLYADVCLKQAIGEHSQGEAFPWVCLDYSTGVLQICVQDGITEENADPLVEEYQLQLTVVGKRKNKSL